MTTNRFSFGNVQVVVKKGDLTKEEADIIVNAANNEGYMGGGVAAALKKKGGTAIEDEAVAKGPVAVGDVIITGAGDLKARHVVHAAVMAMDFKTDETAIYEAALESLRAADELGAKTIAFPAFGTGVGRIEPDVSATAMLQAVKDHTEEFITRLEEIRFVVRGDAIYNAFAAEADQLSR